MIDAHECLKVCSPKCHSIPARSPAARTTRYNQSGTVVDTFNYDPYGKLTSTTGSVYEPIQYARAYNDSAHTGGETLTKFGELASVCHAVAHAVTAVPKWMAIRTKIKRLLRRHNFKGRANGGGSFDRDHVTNLVMDQARTLYRYWPDMFACETF